MTSTNILIIGSGGREHALIHALKRSPSAGKIYALPGNGGINRDAEAVNIPVDDHAAIARFCAEKHIGMVIVGPEEPLVKGIADSLEAHGIPVFGPSAKAAQIEGSKAFMKEIAVKYHVPTAKYATFTDLEKAKAYIRKEGAPIVIKTDGLAAGKGVAIPHTVEEALKELDAYFAGKFGTAGQKVVIEEFMEGEEASFFAICDGTRALSFGSAQDHKAVGDGDTGPNTGGMGAYSPAPVMTAALEKRVMEEIITPVVRGMAAEGAPYKGVLFAGLMIDKQGNPKLIEFNARFGDPECQVLMLRLESDIVALLLAAANGDISGRKVELSEDAALCVVMAAKGYPGEYRQGTEIKGLEAAGNVPGALVFHAGTRHAHGKWLAHGGRVLGIAAVGGDVQEAQRRAYQAVDALDWPEGFCRRDIGWRAVARLKGGH